MGHLQKRTLQALVFLFMVSTYASTAESDALREFFSQNNRLVLMNPFPASAPIGMIVRPDQGELREINRDCFTPYQNQVVPPEPYEFIQRSREKKRSVTTRLLSHIGAIDIGRDEKVSIDVVEGKKTWMPENRFKKIIGAPDFSQDCLQTLRDKRNYVIYEVITGKLVFTFYRKSHGQWEAAPPKLPFAPNAPNQSQEPAPFGVEWITTTNGGIQMKDPRVLAYHARHWTTEAGEFTSQMPWFQFKRIKDLDFKLKEK